MPDEEKGAGKGKPKGRESPGGTTVPIRDPEIPYEHAAFGLEQFRKKLDKFRFALDPLVWTDLDTFKVTLKEKKVDVLLENFKYWEEKIVLSCSTLENCEQAIDGHQEDFDHCEDVLGECQLIIMKARAQCTSEGAKSKSSTFKLDKVKLPTFSGNFVEWQDFADLFKAAVNDDTHLPSAVKLKYLKDSLVGEAASIVATFPSLPNSYDEAWKLVEDRFDNPREIVFAHLRKLFSFKSVPDTSKGLRQLCDSVNECTRALTMLKLEVDKWDVILVFLCVTKLDDRTKTEWLLTQEKKLPVLSDFLSFLEKRATALTDPRSVSKAKAAATSSHHTSTDGSKFSCPKCGEGHRLYLCDTFANMQLKAKWKFVKEKKLCENCLNGHPTAECKAKFNCKNCHQRHSVHLHKDDRNATASSSRNRERSTGNGQAMVTTNSQGQPAESQSPQASTSTVGVSSNHASSPTSESVVLMATLLVDVLDSSGQKTQCRAFFDPGSEANFISENTMNRLGLRRQRSCVRVSGIGGQLQETAKGMVNFDIFSQISDFVLPVQALILNTLTGNMPRASCKADYSHLHGLTLADPTFHSPSRIDILLGAEVAPLIIIPGLRRGPQGSPLATNSRFGWFLTGSAKSISDHTTTNYNVRAFHSSCSPKDPCLEAAIQRFWELEEPEPSPGAGSLEDQACESHFVSNHGREPDGRFVVQLPFTSSDLQLGESRGKAIKCLRSLEKRLQKYPELKDSYHTQFENFLKWNWIEPVCPSSSPSPCYYMPHHVVTKLDSTTTKHRIVFNASASSTNGNSLNTVLMSGPKIQTDLHPLLVRFRSHPVALSVDIVKFYQQVKVAENHRDYQRIVYSKGPLDPIKDYKFNRVTFGVTSSPFLAIRCLQQLGIEHRDQFPRASNAISHDFLVDNLLSGAETAKEALDLKSQLIEVLSKGQFPLQKWASNNSEVSTTFPEIDKDSYSLNLQVDDSIKTIGMYWHPASDTFGVKISVPPPTASATKREVLSFTARVFDPLGWLAPVTVTPWILLQELWREKCDWDDPIKPELFLKWKKYCVELELLKEFRINRCLVFQSPLPSTTYDLIGFCDASQLAYAGCVYLRSTSTNAVKVELIAAKPKVAPIQGETIPRLELCGAVLLTNLLNFVSTALLPSKTNISQVLAFTDSTAVLGQLFSKDKQPVFVANRVRKILRSKVTISWYHVPGELNPADAASRGISANALLQHPLWLHGPEFLVTGDFPSQPYPQCLVVSISASRSSFVKDAIHTLIQSCSSFIKMKRLLAYWIRFVQALKAKSHITGPLTYKEIESALVPLIKTVQATSFPKEIQCCESQLRVKTNIKYLSPFLDSQGVLRVGGRLQMSDLPWDQQHPILLPKGHGRPSKDENYVNGHLTRIIARLLHDTYEHCGPQELLSVLRQQFWIPRGLDLCTQVIRRCVLCHRANPGAATQVMGQLPSPRVALDFPFVQVGVDYAGPFEIAITPGRKPRLLKAYVCVFVCMAIKAVHLEYAGDLSTPSFVAAFQRFVSIRNDATDIYCDGGGNFKGAKAHVEALQNLVTSTSHQNAVAKCFAGTKVQFHFSPPRGPHHGGLWEAAVKSMKYHLARIIQGHHVSLEEFITILARTSAALNSRPLTPLSSSPDDFKALTPFHFLTLRPPKMPTEVDYTETKTLRDHWQLAQQMSQHLFQRWRREYLQSLQQKYKWLEPQNNIEAGTMVLLHDVDAALGPQRWVLGRIHAVHPGPDGRVRIVDVKIPCPDKEDRRGTGHKMIKTPFANFKIFRRPITRVSPLPIDEETVQCHVSLQQRQPT